MGKKQRTRTKISELTFDLIIDIISRAPYKDLMRFTCVSKSWCSLINTDSYLSQLRSHRTALLHRPFLIIQKTDSFSSWSLCDNYWVDLESIEDGNPNPRQLHNPFDHDDDSPGRDARVVASCEGLLVLQQIHSGKIVVSNPTTKEHHAVPPNPAGDDNVEIIGFGYDPVHGCYKLVTKIKDASEEDRVLDLVIYYVNNGTWKKSRFDRVDECYIQMGECIDGALYWFYHSGELKTAKLVCFVLAEEKFHGVGLPHSDEYMYCSDATVFDGRLCLVLEDEDDERTELWLMECDYKRQLSYSWRWIKFLSVSVSELPTSNSRFFCLVPVCLSTCKNKILCHVDGGQLFWYDLGSYQNKFNKLKTPVNEFSHRGPTDVKSCVPSLVRINAS